MGAKACYAVIVVKVQSFANDGSAIVKALERAENGDLEPTISIKKGFIRELIFSDAPPAPIIEADG